MKNDSEITVQNEIHGTVIGKEIEIGVENTATENIGEVGIGMTVLGMGDRSVIETVVMFTIGPPGTTTEDETVGWKDLGGIHHPVQDQQGHRHVAKVCCISVDFPCRLILYQNTDTPIRLDLLLDARCPRVANSVIHTIIVVPLLGVRPETAPLGVYPQDTRNLVKIPFQTAPIPQYDTFRSFRIKLKNMIQNNTHVARVLIHPMMVCGHSLIYGLY